MTAAEFTKSSSSHSIKLSRCYACDRVIAGAPKLADCADDQKRLTVGPCCFKKIKAAGAEGYQPPRGGPRLFPHTA